MANWKSFLSSALILTAALPAAAQHAPEPTIAAEMTLMAAVPQVVDPRSLYSNVTGFSSTPVFWGAAANSISGVVADDLTFTTPATGTVSRFRFTVGNANALALTAGVVVHFWQADGPSLGAGLPNGPGTQIAAYRITSGGNTTISFPANNSILFNVGATVALLNLPPNTTQTIWAGVRVDNNNGAASATPAQLANFAQLLTNPVDRGSSTDVMFRTPDGATVGTNPAGSGFDVGAGVSNVAWELVGAQADLSVTLADGPDPVIAGNNLTYTAVLTNSGPDVAPIGTSLVANIPAGTTLVSATADNSGTCTGSGPVNCTWPAFILPAATRTVTVVVAVPANTAGGTILNANVSAGSIFGDPTPGNNSASAGTGVVTDANLAMTLTDSPDPVIAGTQLSYTATLTNGGPSDAQNARFSVTIPAGASFVSATPTGGSCTGTTTVTCTWAGVTTPGTSRSASIVIDVPPATAQGTILVAAGTATSDTADAVPANNNAEAITTVNTSADVSITLVDSPDPVTAGAQLTYTATATKTGPSDAQDVSITLPLPAGTSFVSALANAGGTCTGTTTVSCIWPGATAPGVSRIATVVVLVSPAQSANLSATATAASVTSDPNSANNSATATTTVQAQADLGITLTDAPDPVTAGTQLTYTATVTNAGPSDATAVVVSLPTPAGTSFVSGTVSGGGSCAAGISCSISGSMAPGASRTVTIVVLVAPAVLDGTVINATATVSGGTPDPNAANNSASTTTAVIARADLQIALNASTLQVLINVPVTFTATSTNNGPSDAQNVSITLTLTPDFRYTSHTAAGATCTTPQVGTTGSIVCTWAGATAPGVVRTLEVVAYSNVEGSTAVSASTTSNTIDPVANNNASALSVMVGYPFNEIPTLGQYGLVLLGLLIGLFGLAAVRRYS